VKKIFTTTTYLVLGTAGLRNLRGCIFLNPPVHNKINSSSHKFKCYHLLFMLLGTGISPPSRCPEGKALIAGKKLARLGSKLKAIIFPRLNFYFLIFF